MFNALESLPVTATVLVILIAVAVFASHEAGIDFVIVEPLSVMVGSDTIKPVLLIVLDLTVDAFKLIPIF